MKTLFSLDNPFIQMLGRVWDFILLNLLFLVCCFPVITAGAAAVALHSVCTDIAYEEDSGIISSFFRAFKSNFKQSTISWLGIVAVLSAELSYLIIGYTFWDPKVVEILVIVLFIVLSLVLSLWSYLMDLIPRYDNTLREHVFNAGVLCIIKLPRTLGLLALLLFPIILAFLSMQVFIYTLIFWLMVGFSFTRYLCCLILRPVHKELEQDGGPAPTIFK